MIIAHNINSIKAGNSLDKANKKRSSAMEKLSTGLKINRASDDAAGLTISEGMKIKIMGLQQATSNSQDGISLVQTAEGALSEIQSVLQRVRELAVQASNGTYTSDDRENIQKEVSQAIKQVDSIRNTTQFNSRKLIDGSASTGAVSGNWYDGWQVEHITPGAIDGSNGNPINENTLLYNVKDLNNNYLFPPNSQNTITLKYNYSGVGYEKSLSINCDNNTTVGDVLAKLNDENVSTSISNEYVGTDSFVVTLPLEVDEAPSSSWSMSVTDTKTGSTVEPANTFFFNNGNFGTSRSIPANSNNGQIILQIGSTSNSFDSMKININDMGVKALGIEELGVSTQLQANTAISKLDTAIDKVSSERAKLGSYQNRLEHTINNLGVSSQNITEAEAQITDTDMAKEMMKYSKEGILSQATMAMLVQANDEPKNMVELLKPQN